MPTARELLEQADALMRRNRARAVPQNDIPELTDEVPVAAPDVVVPAGARPARSLFAFQPPAPADRDDVPELTDAVEEIEAVPLEAIPDDGGEVSRWLETGLGEASITGLAPDSIAVVPPATLRSPSDEKEALWRGASAAGANAAATGAVPAAPDAAPPTSAAAMLAATAAGAIAPPAAAGPPTRDPAFEAMLGMAPAPTPAEAAFDEELDRMRPVAPGESAAARESAAPEEAAPSARAGAPSAQPLAGDAARWDALAEEVRMQVLQRIDIFTDTGLQEQLTARLQPIVDRASADLVATINQQVGQLLRAYVAEAIEREIEKWRQGDR